MAFTLAPHTRSTAGDLLRVLASWLALLLFVQGLAAAQALGAGPLHRHGDAVSTLRAAHHHSDAQQHHHAAGGASVAAVAEEGTLDLAAFALTAALTLMALAVYIAGPRLRVQVWCAARAWAWRTTFPAVLRKPPRLA